LIDGYFKLSENQTSVRQEMLGGLTTFVTMSYIIVVNPQILGHAGMPVEGVVFATCVSAAVATLVMGLYANYPIALAPGMSLNAYFTYSVCIAMNVPWRTALAVVFFSGSLFLVLTLTRVREQIVNGIPDCLKHSTAAGIGMFIAFVGMRNAKLVVANSAHVCRPRHLFGQGRADGLPRSRADASPGVASSPRRNLDWDPWYVASGSSPRHNEVARGDLRPAAPIVHPVAA
jgi:xanthine/uracil/vitamin C permease (AzgA family)